LQAIHILNKYEDPDHGYPHPGPSWWPWDHPIITPRQVAREIEQYRYNGYGVTILGKGQDVASGVRSNVFLVLETMLGYGCGDNTSRTYADNLFQILKKTQVGYSPFLPYRADTAENGTVVRPPYHGSQLLCWQYDSGISAFKMPLSWMDIAVDVLSMEPEDKGIILSNTETTATYFQALRVYLAFKYCTFFPTRRMIPLIYQ
jgi:hypothetical protein